MSFGLNSCADAAHGLAKILIEHARAQDYRRTEILDLEVQPLAENMATLTGIFVRFNSADQEISRFGFAYTMFRDGTGWKIVVGLAHAPYSGKS